MTALTIDDRVSAVEHALWNELSVRVDSMNVGIGQVAYETKLMRDDQAGFRIAMADFESSVGALKATMDQRISDVRIELGDAQIAIRHDITRLSNVVTRRFDAVDIRFTSLDEQLSDSKSQLSSVETKLDTVDSRLSTVDAKLDTVDAKLDTLTDAVLAHSIPRPKLRQLPWSRRGNRAGTGTRNPG